VIVRRERPHPVRSSMLTEDAPVQVLDQLHRLGQIVGDRQRVRHRLDLRREVHRNDLGALSGKRDSVGTALPPRSTRDQSYLPVQSANGNPTSVLDN
jgi:hypothetical protein